ncbi:integrase arm-type DNA-binding domain-containing protein [Pseudophaeobacter sp.]|jgi:integrase|uniref:tyrosine-type recombinase/integrase n=1 Tax=Pseudophaeobacter sp. TaxID=1971739 RepID=UPI0032D8D09D
MARNKLKALEVKKGDGKLFDGSGLYLQKRSVETGRWVYRYKHQGRSREMGLGPYPTVSLSDARKERDQWESILKAGEDPMTARDRLREEAQAEASRHDPTFEEAALTTFEAKKAGLRGDGTAGRWLSPVRLYMTPAIGNRRMSALHQSDIHAALAPIWKAKHPTAEKAIQRTKIIFEHMRFSGVACDPFVVDMARHMLGEVRHQVVKTPAAEWQDIPRIFQALNRNDASHLALRFNILTLVRSAGVRGARFDEIQDGIWTVPASRMKGTVASAADFRVPLSGAALEVVARADEWRRSSFMFPGGRSGGISDVAVAKVLRKVAPGTTPHGMRTSFRTWVQDTDAASYDVAETALAHIVGGKVERAYARSDLLERRRVLMEAWADFVTGIETKVVPIRGRQ